MRFGVICYNLSHIMSFLYWKLSDGFISLRENTRDLAVTYIIHPCFLFPAPICLIWSSSTLAVIHFATATLVSLLYFKHDGQTSVWNTVPNACNIEFCSNVTFSMRHSLIDFIPYPILQFQHIPALIFIHPHLCVISVTIWKTLPIKLFQ